MLLDHKHKEKTPIHIFQVSKNIFIQHIVYVYIYLIE